jgi:hypothetical protein
MRFEYILKFLGKGDRSTESFAFYGDSLMLSKSNFDSPIKKKDSLKY